jgi:hypothetical protein
MYFNQEVMDINRHNYEDNFLLYLDNELGRADRELVEKFLEDNADLRKEFALLQHTVFASEDLVFEPKACLIRKEEKRRILPLYWTRIAAVAAGLVLGGWFILSQLKRNDTAGKTNISEGPVARSSAGKDKINAGTTLEKGEPANQLTGKTMISDLLQTEKKKGRGLKNLPSAKSGDKIRSGYSGVPVQDNDLVLEETPVAFRKSGTAVVLQNGAYNSAGDLKQITQPADAFPAALVLSGSALENKHQYEKAMNPAGSTTNENAISVIALSDQNKGIGGFLKKLTGRELSGDDTKKVRVNIFQISY